MADWAEPLRLDRTFSTTRPKSALELKHFNLGENVRAALRVDYFNAFNRTRFNNPDSNINDGSFGEVTGEGSQIIYRQGQVSFRVEF